NAAVAEVAFVPEGDVLQGGQRVAAQDARQAGEPFARDRVALVRHGAGAFLALGETFFGFEHFGALQVAELGGPPLHARPDERQRAEELGVDVALDDLRGDGRRPQTQLAADLRLDARSQVCAGADGAGEFAYGRGLFGAFEPAQSPAELIVH